MTGVTGSAGVTDNPPRHLGRRLSRMTFVLAVATTGTAICMSVLAGWQRGGELPERLVWVAIGVVLVVSAHLLPALCRASPWFLRSAGVLLWVACMATACFGHATFFVLAQQHAGERRALALVPPVIGANPPGRSLTAIMADRASVMRQLAIAGTQRCKGDCPALSVRRIALAARLDALDAEAGEVRRQQAMDDRQSQRRDGLAVDPVTGRLAALLGTTVSRVDLLSGLVFAAVLECVACLLWSLALRAPLAVTTTEVVEPAGADQVLVPPSDRPSGEPLFRAETELSQLAGDVAAGHVRATVAGIRRHLNCSQAKAVALRRQLAQSEL